MSRNGNILPFLLTTFFSVAKIEVYLLVGKILGDFWQLFMLWTNFYLKNSAKFCKNFGGNWTKPSDHRKWLGVSFLGKGAKIKISNKQTNSGATAPKTVVNQINNFRDINATGSDPWVSWFPSW